MNHPQANGARAHADAASRAQPSDVILISPVSGQPLEPVVAASSDDIAEAVAKAREAQVLWSARSLRDRIETLRRAAKEMLRWRAELIDLVRVEMGKVDAEGLFNEALGPLDNVNGWAKVVSAATGTHRTRLNPVSFPNKRAYVEYVPRGVIGVIAPWNFPVAGLFRSVFPALMTGNGVVLKPSEYSPRASGWLAEKLAAELPQGLMRVVQGDGAVGSALIDAGIDACVFTGSPRAGRRVRVQCAERGIPSSIEMGGKDPAIVLADCNLSRTVAGVTHWALSNVGQACGAIEVAYVDQPIADEFVDRLRSAWECLRTGPDDFATLDVGPLANRRQLEVVMAHVDDARTKGAKLVCGGKRGEGLFYAPTILDHCSETMSVVRDETFGPVLAIVRVDGAMDAIRRANRSRYGLGASIWSQDIGRAERLAQRLDYGVVTINNHALSGAIPALPWSGTRDTGFGIANGPQSLGTFVRPRTVVVDRSSEPDLFWMPYDSTLRELGETLADAQIGRFERLWRVPIAMRDRIRTVRAFFR